MTDDELIGEILRKLPDGFTFIRHKLAIEKCVEDNVPEPVCEKCNGISTEVKVTANNYDELVVIFVSILASAQSSHICWRIVPESMVSGGNIIGYMRYSAGAQS